MGPFADGLNGGLSCPNKFGNLTIRKLRVELNQPKDRRWAVLTLGQRRVARTTAFFFSDSGGMTMPFSISSSVAMMAGPPVLAIMPTRLPAGIGWAAKPSL